LKEVATGALTEEQIHAIVHAACQLGVGVEAALMLSHTEWTAHCHGVWFSDLAKWRYHGWPNHCVNCGKEIDVERFGWMANEVDNEGCPAMKHAVCP